MPATHSAVWNTTLHDPASVDLDVSVPAHIIPAATVNIIGADCIAQLGVTTVVDAATSNNQMYLRPGTVVADLPPAGFKCVAVGKLWALPLRGQNAIGRRGPAAARTKKVRFRAAVAPRVSGHSSGGGSGPDTGLCGPPAPESSEGECDPDGPEASATGATGGGSKQAPAGRYCASEAEYAAVGAPYDAEAISACVERGEFLGQACATTGCNACLLYTSPSPRD